MKKVQEKAIFKISDIVMRYCEILKESDPHLSIDRFSRIMDLDSVHQSIGLDLDAMLASDDFDLVHDIAGIQRHLNRDTRLLEDCFLPRFASRQETPLKGLERWVDGS